jgi:hypothetical protein
VSWFASSKIGYSARSTPLASVARGNLRYGKFVEDFFRRDKRIFADASSTPAREQMLVCLHCALSDTNRSRQVFPENPGPVPSCESEADNVLKVQKMHARNGAIPARFLGKPGLGALIARSA